MEALRENPRTPNGVLQYAIQLMQEGMYFGASCVLRLLHENLPKPERKKTASLLAQCGMALRSSELMSYATESQMEVLQKRTALMQDTTLHEAMKAQLDEARVASPAAWFAADTETSIAVCAGGKTLMAQLWCNLHSLKHVGCKLPVQVFHAAEVDEDEQATFIRVFEPHFPVSFVDLSKSVLCTEQAMTPEKLRGFQIKLAALCMTTAQRVLLMDADILWLSDPSRLMDECMCTYDALIFSDIWHFENKKHERTSTTTLLYDIHRLSSGIQEWESGVVYLDRAQLWPTISILHHICIKYDYYFSLAFGDKDLYHIALATCGAKCHPRMPVPRILGCLRDAAEGSSEFISHSMLQQTIDRPSHVHMTLHPISDPESANIPTHICDAQSIKFVTRTIQQKTVGTIACDCDDAQQLCSSDRVAIQNVYTAARAMLLEYPGGV